MNTMPYCLLVKLQEEKSVSQLQHFLLESLVYAAVVIIWERALRRRNPWETIRNSRFIVCFLS